MDSFRRRRSKCLVMILSCLVFFFFFYVCISNAQSTLKAGQAIGGSLVSPNERFKLLFFSLNSSQEFSGNWFLGIQFMKVDTEKLVWVANPKNPLSNDSPILNLTHEGNMMIYNYNKENSFTIYSMQPAAMSSSGSNTTLTLLDSGNLVLRAGDQTVWQSFDYLSDTLLPGMKLGVVSGLKTANQQNQFLTSWMNPEDPAAGSYTLGIDPNNTEQLVIWKRGAPYWRSGIWNGIEFSYFPYMGVYYINIDHISNGNDSYYTISPILDNSYVWIVMNSIGSLTMYAESGNGKVHVYITNCIDKVEDISQGCVMPEPSNCKSGDDFPLTSGLMSEWDYLNNISLGLSDCKELCMNNCSCTAYSSVQSDGTGCRFSQGQKLVNITSKVESFYLRNGPIVDKVRPRKRRWLWLTISGPAVSLVVLSILSLLCYRGKLNYFCFGFGDTKRSRSQGDTELMMNELGATLAAIDKQSGARKVDLSGKRDPKLHLFNFSSIQVATENFSDANKIGQGGFGRV